jgi:hypothetical protein
VCSSIAGEFVGLAGRGSARIWRWVHMVQHWTLEVLDHGLLMLVERKA